MSENNWKLLLGTILTDPDFGNIYFLYILRFDCYTEEGTFAFVFIVKALIVTKY